MSSVSRIFLLFSIFMRPNLCQDSAEKPKVKQDLLIALLCVFVLLLILLVAGCCILQCGLMSKDTSGEEEVSAFAFQEQHMESSIAQNEELDASQWASQEELEPLSAEPPKSKPSLLSFSRVYRTHSSERFHCNNSGTVYSLEDFQSISDSSVSISQESPGSKVYQGEDLGGGGGHNSDSTLLFEIHHEMSHDPR